MSTGTKKIAPGHAPELQPKTGSENKTPAPVKAFDPTAKDRTYGRTNYGANGSSFPSSLPPGTATPKGAVNANAPVDAVLEGLQRNGVRGLDAQDPWETRDLTDKRDNNRGRVPVHPGTQGARSGGTVPTKTGTNRD